MDAFSIVRPISSAIYGRVVLVRHCQSGRYYALKAMSIPHMQARRAVTGPYVQEDGFAELHILRGLGCNQVFSADATGGDNQAEECQENQDIQEEIELSNWSVSPTWSNGVDLVDPFNHPEQQHQDSRYMLRLHQDFVDPTTNTRCLLFDYCPYGDLYAQVAARAGTRADGNGGLPLEMARTYFLQIASAVRFLHAQDVAHRDLSLENVLLDASRSCRLADFGLACASGSRCVNARAGKLLYMAPEVVVRPRYQPQGASYAVNAGIVSWYNALQADIWSLGVILFILVTGIPPFEKASEDDARFRVVAKPGGSITELLQAWGQQDRVPGQLRALMEWMLHLDPCQRPTAEQVCAHEWFQEARDLQQQQTAEESPRWGEKRSTPEPEEENDRDHDKYWLISPRCKKRAKRVA